MVEDVEIPQRIVYTILKRRHRVNNGCKDDIFLTVQKLNGKINNKPIKEQLYIHVHVHTYIHTYINTCTVLYMYMSI